MWPDVSAQHYGLQKDIKSKLVFLGLIVKTDWCNEAENVPYLAVSQ